MAEVTNGPTHAEFIDSYGMSQDGKATSATVVDETQSSELKEQLRSKIWSDRDLIVIFVRTLVAIEEKNFKGYWASELVRLAKKLAGETDKGDCDAMGRLIALRRLRQ